jgi:hypothetical protein
MRTKAFFAMIVCLFACLLFVLAAEAKDKAPPTAVEIAEKPPVEIKADALKYGTILFKDFTSKPEFKADAGDALVQTQAAAIARLKEMKGFTAVGTYAAGTPAPTNPTLYVDALLIDHRVVGGAARMWGGAMAGSSHLAYTVTLTDAQTGKVVATGDVTTGNNAMAAAWSGGGSDRDLAAFLGKMIADWVADKAKK